MFADEDSTRHKSERSYVTTTCAEANEEGVAQAHVAFPEPARQLTLATIDPLQSAAIVKELQCICNGRDRIFLFEELAITPNARIISLTLAPRGDRVNITLPLTVNTATFTVVDQTLNVATAHTHALFDAAGRCVVDEITVLGATKHPVKIAANEITRVGTTEFSVPRQSLGSSVVRQQKGFVCTPPFTSLEALAKAISAYGSPQGLNVVVNAPLAKMEISTTPMTLAPNVLSDRKVTQIGGDGLARAVFGFGGGFGAWSVFAVESGRSSDNISTKVAAALNRFTFQTPQVFCVRDAALVATIINVPPGSYGSPHDLAKSLTALLLAASKKNNSSLVTVSFVGERFVFESATAFDIFFKDDDSDALQSALRLHSTAGGRRYESRTPIPFTRPILGRYAACSEANDAPLQIERLPDRSSEYAIAAYASGILQLSLNDGEQRVFAEAGNVLSITSGRSDGMTLSGEVQGIVVEHSTFGSSHPAVMFLSVADCSWSSAKGSNVCVCRASSGTFALASFNAKPPARLAPRAGATGPMTPSASHAEQLRSAFSASLPSERLGVRPGLLVSQNGRIVGTNTPGCESLIGLEVVDTSSNKSITSNLSTLADGHRHSLLAIVNAVGKVVKRGTVTIEGGSTDIDVRFLDCGGRPLYVDTDQQMPLTLVFDGIFR